jgi:hypothetical protein
MQSKLKILPELQSEPGFPALSATTSPLVTSGVNMKKCIQQSACLFGRKQGGTTEI